MAAPKIGVRYYGTSMAAREWIEFLAVEDEEVAFRYKARGDGALGLLVDGARWWVNGAWTEYYSEIPPKPEWKVGDKILTDWCGSSCLYYELDHKTESVEMGVPRPYWYARRFGSDGNVAPVALEESLFIGYYDK